MSQFPIDRVVTRAILNRFQTHGNDVLTNEEDRRARTTALYKALSFECHHQERIVFWIEDDAACIPILSRVVALGDRSVFLEKNMLIPISSICRVQFLQVAGRLFS